MEYRIHIGAHKTATTQFQDLLETVFHKHPNETIKYLSRDHLRKNNFSKIDINPRSFLEMQFIRPGHKIFRNTVFQGLVEQFRENSCILISEENIIGGVRDLLDGFYPNADRSLLALKCLIKDNPTKIFLSIRNYAELLPSAYCQILRGRTKAQPFNYYLSQFHENDSGWPSLIRRIIKIFPIEDLHVWTFENYIQNPFNIAKLFIGSDIETLVPLTKPKQVTRLTTGQVREIENNLLSSRNGLSENLISEILLKHLDDEIYSPFTSQELNDYTERYNNDLKIIKNIGINVI